MALYLQVSFRLLLWIGLLQVERNLRIQPIEYSYYTQHKIKGASQSFHFLRQLYLVNR